MSAEEKEILELFDMAQIRKMAFAEKMPLKPYHLTQEECYLEHADTVPLIRFRSFEGLIFINAAFSTRFGGVSGGFLSSLNLGFGRGDLEENVAKNYKLFCKSMGVSAETLVLSDQVHDTVIHTATKEDTCQGQIGKKLKGIDGLMTNQPDICLATSYADCVPLFFVDTKKQVIASSHSGWKGTAAKMGAKTVDAMAETYGSERADLVAVIGPSICQDCYEVSEDVIDVFRSSYSEEQMEKIASVSNSNDREGKYRLDLWAANFLQLQDVGLAPENIHVSGICTCCNSRLLFSHRATGGKRGNLNGFITIK